MKNAMLLLALLCPFLIRSQIIFNETGFRLGTLNPYDDCSVSYFLDPAAPTPLPIRFPGNIYTDLALHPNGKLYGLTGQPGAVYLVEIDVKKGTNRDSLVRIETLDCTSLVCDPNGVFYLGYEQLISYDPRTAQLKTIGNLPFGETLLGDLLFHESHLYGSTRHQFDQSTKIYRIDLKDPFNASSVVYTFDEPGTGFVALAPLWDPEEQQMKLFGNDIRNTETQGYENRIFNWQLAPAQVSERCVVHLPDEAVLPRNRKSIYGFTSPDEFRTNFALRLDLDEDDSSGRFIDHFEADTLCTRRFAIADEDVYVAIESGVIDSLVITFRRDLSPPGAVNFDVPDQSLFLVQSNSDDRLVIGNRGEAQPEDFAEIIRSIRLIFDEDSAPGERRLDCLLYAAGTVSDTAKAFIQLDLNSNAFAGQDFTIEACPDGTGINLRAHLGPGIDESGYWVPPLQGSVPFVYSSVRDTPGVYLYVVQQGDCVADTARMTALERTPPPLGILPDGLVHTVPLCPGDTLHWDVSLENATGYFWLDGFQGTNRPLTEPGAYSVYVTDETGCEWLAKTLVTASADTLRSVEYKELCLGDTLTWRGQFLTRDTSICELEEQALACPVEYCVEVYFEPSIEINRTAISCDGEPYEFYGTLLTDAGIYTHVLNADKGCDTLVNLRLTTGNSNSVEIDTAIVLGDSLRIGLNQYLTEPGLHFVYLSNASGCDSLVTVRLDIVSSIHRPLGGDYFLPGLLRRGQAFTLYTANRAATGVELLEIYTLNGKRIFRNTKIRANDPTGAWRGLDLNNTPVPPGMYIYRIRLADGRHAAGKVVVIN
ncbi:hypothetical protein [Flavilitoribacter nigricans]|uniref:T9SS type A sorting domain-containing protein n=1 Tax=Flavilitoribacter nigricans (strain ATCC 23147 / DSM 23189 / NBRC 102662 / NCIMB 1420 / SS-2) TaxID=1122177 RepID=A0A2D0N1E0_FLAN2|nr:hypothetical protein [Flavilitoribacter nigricans]PHN02362.1 hypothetical protein CRP01_32475 [Flavilitoribacter nigricans DSM 23189 = NBRC 102662]